MAFRPLAHRRFDRPVRLDSPHHVCRTRMESMAKVVHRSSDLIKDQASQLLPHTYNDNHRLQTSSRISLAPISTRDVCLHLTPTLPLLPGLLYSRTTTSHFQISLFDQHLQKHNKQLFSHVPFSQHKEQQPLP
jgi:hypothetical protein